MVGLRIPKPAEIKSTEALLLDRHSLRVVKEKRLFLYLDSRYARLVQRSKQYGRSLIVLFDAVYSDPLLRTLLAKPTRMMAELVALRHPTSAELSTVSPTPFSSALRVVTDPSRFLVYRAARLIVPLKRLNTGAQQALGFQAIVRLRFMGLDEEERRFVFIWQRCFGLLRSARGKGVRLPSPEEMDLLLDRREQAEREVGLRK
jgi:hypothetical protein